MSKIIKPRFTLIGRTGKRIVSESKIYVAVIDQTTDLMWPVQDASESSVPHAEAMELAGKFRLLKFKDWRGPEQLELESLRNLTLFNPAADPLLKLKPEAYWSNTAAAGWPSGAWGVLFSSGGAGRWFRNGYARVRAVRVASQ